MIRSFIKVYIRGPAIIFANALSLFTIFYLFIIILFTSIRLNGSLEERQ